MSNECAICLEELDYNNAILKCGHVYHYDCIVSWMNQIKDYNKFCPYCRNTDNEIVNITNVNKESKNLTYINNQQTPNLTENVNQHTQIDNNLNIRNYNQHTQIDNNSNNRNYNQFRLNNYHSQQYNRNRLNSNKNRCIIL
jgi:hypothetical protein